MGQPYSRETSQTTATTDAAAFKVSTSRPEFSSISQSSPASNGSSAVLSVPAHSLSGIHTTTYLTRISSAAFSLVPHPLALSSRRTCRYTAVTTLALKCFTVLISLCLRSISRDGIRRGRGIYLGLSVQPVPLQRSQAG